MAFSVAMIAGDKPIEKQCEHRVTRIMEYFANYNPFMCAMTAVASATVKPPFRFVLGTPISFKN
jgi:hypothetical protein